MRTADLQYSGARGEEAWDVCPIHPAGHEYPGGRGLCYSVYSANQTGETLICDRWKSTDFLTRRLQIADVIRILGVHQVQVPDDRCTRAPLWFVVRHVLPLPHHRVRLTLEPPIIPVGSMRTVIKPPANGAQLYFKLPAEGA